VEKNAKKRGTEELAKAYLAHLYTPEAQDIAGKHFYRPRNSKSLAKWSKNFPKINLVHIDREFGGWAKAQKVHFSDGGTFDQIYKR
jgi:sulfate/thiosulfate transport system substrate-binding protein